MAESQSSFYSILFRQKYIKRWGLMNSVTPENLCEHSAETAILAHALAVIATVFPTATHISEKTTIADARQSWRFSTTPPKFTPEICPLR